MIVQGYHGIEEDIYISLPVVVGESGITSVFNQKLSDDERSKIVKSAKTLREVLDGVKMWCDQLASAHLASDSVINVQHSSQCLPVTGVCP